MSVRNSIGCTFVVALLLLPGLAGCQPGASWAGTSANSDSSAGLGPSAAGSNATVTKEGDKKLVDAEQAPKVVVSQKDFDGLVARVAALEQSTYNEMKQIRADLKAANERAAKAESLSKLAVDVDQKLDKVQGQVKANESDLLANALVTREQQALIGQIATKDNSGRWIPAIGPTMNESAQFKEEFRKAVRDVIPPQQSWGTVRLENRMLTSQFIEVNGIGHLVAPQGTIDVIVPAGRVSTWLTKYEDPKTWTLKAPDYLQRVIIDYQ